MWHEKAMDSFDRANSLEDLKLGLQHTIRFIGFEAFNHVDCSNPSVKIPDFIGTASRKWVDCYLSEGFNASDPAVPYAMRSISSFNWNAIPRPATGRKGRKARESLVFDAAYDHGFTQGLVFPFHARDGRGNPRSAITALLWRNPEEDFNEQMKKEGRALGLCIRYWQEKASRFTWPDSHLGWSEEQASLLTARERDVLCWSARGLTMPDTARVMDGISVETVKTHMKSIMAKLNAQTQAHAVAIAMQRGMIDL